MRKLKFDENRARHETPASLCAELVVHCARNDAYRGALCPPLAEAAGPARAGGGDEGADAVLDVLARSAVLGGGAMEALYPTDLDSFYSEEAGWTRLGGL